MENKLTPKPSWLRKKITPTVDKNMKELLEKAGANTVCQEAMCPNISECFKHNQATFLIMGTICTRKCTFCAVSKGKPIPLDSNEPENIAKAVKQLGLKYVVITSSTRDDLCDGGAEHFCKTVSAIKSIDNSIDVELLIPDMKENKEALEKVMKSGATIIGHNLETVPRLYNIRKGASYERSLRVLNILSSFGSLASIKSGIMLGLGEKDDEVITLMEDLIGVGCSYLSIGQYLSPSSKHTKVIEYVDPKKFEYFKDIGEKMGFKYIKSSPYTRSSYMAHEYLEGGD
ncbi:MAG: lipoyl synthase [Campylobacterota bacterium]|nr:lipoyl synthase [Campylobacterota bacterium]